MPQYQTSWTCRSALFDVKKSSCHHLLDCALIFQLALQVSHVTSSRSALALALSILAAEVDAI
jgi:hypothetical protein